MVFSEYVFLFVFLPLALGVHLLCPRRLRLLPLTLLSYVFYGWVRYDYCLIILASTLLDYGLARALPSRATKRSRRLLLLASLVGNLGMLAWFKYQGFAIDNFNLLADELGLGRFSALAVALPVGISFYTFQSMSYTIDVYRGQLEPERNLLRFAAYISMFPQLVAGPIVRLRDLKSQLAAPGADSHAFATGAFLFMLGLAKKVLIADSIAGFSNALFDGHASGALNAWGGVLAYTAQIYFDFSGYSDMAIGLGAMLGFRFPQNFDSPYKAASITEFWRRWHITLGSWFRDYLYIPLGGNRRGGVRTAFNLLVVFFLCGLWHGAEWTFVVWGLYHGMLLMIERILGRRAQEARSLARRALTFLLVVIGWIPFRAHSLSDARRIIGELAFGSGLGRFELAGFQPPTQGLVALSLAFLLAFLAPTAYAASREITLRKALLAVALYLLAVIAVLFQEDHPFLYFRF